MPVNMYSKAFVLYVEDDPDDILMVEESLRRHSNIQLTCFLESYKFLRYIMESKPFTLLPSLILIDINMPVLNGRELLTMLRSYEELKDVKMVLYTTSSYPQDSSFAKSLRADFVSKPSSINQLDATMDRLLMECNLLPC